MKIISDDGFWGQENLQEITLGSVVEIGQSGLWQLHHAEANYTAGYADNDWLESV